MGKEKRNEGQTGKEKGRRRGGWNRAVTGRKNGHQTQKGTDLAEMVYAKS